MNTFELAAEVNASELAAKVSVLNEGQSVHIKITAASELSRLHACMF